VGRHKKSNDHPFPYHHELELKIHALTNHGVGLGRVPLPPRGQSNLLGYFPPGSTSKSQDKSNPIGYFQKTGQAQPLWVVMVPFALPGERIRARVFRNHKNYSEADLVEVLTPSPHRIAPRCPLFGRCGGCQYQHLTYAGQLDWKRRQVEELLQHMAGVTFPVAPVIGSPLEYGYRSKITPHFNPPRADGSMPIGFLRQGTRFDVVDVPHCDIATPAINARLTERRAEVLARRGSYQRGATILLREAGGVVTTDFDAVITETVGELKLRFLARDFFQNNPFILPAFTAYVRDQAAAGGARLLVDAYCGSGLFALGAAPAFARVAGVEISESSIAFARQNAAANGIANATFLAGDASAIFAGLDFAAADTAVIIDPPRRGSDEAFLRQLFAFGPRTVVYVSCDPATQMRDLRHFLTAGYTLTAVQPFDLFPQTRHLECVVTLTRSVPLTAAPPGAGGLPNAADRPCSPP
jgi:23S rRNA (uracil1939-C5)-methyltransferase/tRNA (uracil-5-)-methyltransferase